MPILGICYGAQLIALQLGGTVGRGMRGEYGRTTLRRTAPSLLLPDEAADVHDVWMSHFDAITASPPGFVATAATENAPVVVLENDARRIYGVQFHPEVVHTPHGMAVLRRFLIERAGCAPTWTMASVADEQIARIGEQVGDGRAICALSGGVDSAVAAALVHRAIGHRLTCVYVDTGLMRLGESAEVTEAFRRHLGAELIHVDAADRFFDRLHGVVEPEEKRKAIGDEFIRVFEEHTGGLVEAEFLVQGTLYPDLIESGGARRHGRRDQEPPQRRRAARGHGARSWSSRCAICSRTRSACSASSSACPSRWSGANRSPAPVWRSASSAR